MLHSGYIKKTFATVYLKTTFQAKVPYTNFIETKLYRLIMTITKVFLETLLFGTLKNLQRITKFSYKKIKMVVLRFNKVVSGFVPKLISYMFPKKVSIQ